MGTPAVVTPVLEALLDMGAQVAGVYCQPDRPRGRGLEVEAPPVKRWAQARGLPVFQPASLRRPDSQAHLAALRPDVIVVAAYGRILPPEVLRLPPRGCLNLHPSLLPKYRGPAPVAAAILHGDPVTGVTLMLMDEGMDTGPVLAQREEPVRPDDTTETLTARLFRLGAALLRETLPRWVRGEVVPKPQDDARATVTKKIEKEDGEADFTRPAAVLERQLRAYTPWPGLYTRWRRQGLKLLEATPLLLPVEDGPGLVVALREVGVPVGVVCGEGVLGLRRLQLEGRRPVSAQEFINGHRDFVGSRLPS